MKPEGTIKSFPLRTVLTVTTGQLFTKPWGTRNNGIGDLYEILEHMIGELPYTHTLGRFADECKPWLFRWYPELDSPELHIQVAKFSEMNKSVSARGNTQALIEGWLLGIISGGYCQEIYDIGQIPTDNHDRKNPYVELVDMMTEPSQKE